jgi:hypothetical protein
MAQVLTIRKKKAEAAKKAFPRSAKSWDYHSTSGDAI